MIELVVLIVAIFLLYLFFPIIACFMVIKYLFTGNKRMIKVWFYRTARAIDVFANVNGAEFFNTIFITDGGYKFGQPKETISSIIGKNQRSNTLSIAGKILLWGLDKIEKDHCKNSINDDITNVTKHS